MTFEPTSALSSVDLPAFGAPISATKPQRVMSSSNVSWVRPKYHGFAHRSRNARGGHLFSRALGTCLATLRLETLEFDLHDEVRGGVLARCARPRHSAERGERARLRPFLNGGFGVLRGRFLGAAYAGSQERLNQCLSRRKPTIDDRPRRSAIRKRPTGSRPSCARPRAPRPALTPRVDRLPIPRRRPRRFRAARVWPDERKAHPPVACRVTPHTACAKR